MGWIKRDYLRGIGTRHLREELTPDLESLKQAGWSCSSELSRSWEAQNSLDGGGQKREVACSCRSNYPDILTFSVYQGQFLPFTHGSVSSLGSGIHFSCGFHVTVGPGIFFFSNYFFCLMFIGVLPVCVLM